MAQPICGHGVLAPVNQMFGLDCPARFSSREPRVRDELPVGCNNLEASQDGIWANVGAFVQGAARPSQLQMWLLEWLLGGTAVYLTRVQQSS